MSRRVVARAALALIALGAGLLAQPAHVGAATLTKSSWWYRAHTGDSGTFLPPATPAIPGGAPTAPAPAPAPAPPTVADGDLLVEGNAEGATAVAALSWTLSGGEQAPMLTLTPGGSSNVPEGAVILACRAAVAWEEPEAEPGVWEEKPLVDCGASVQGIPNPDGTIAFGLAPLISGTTLDVVLTPGLAQAQPVRVGSSFSLSFAAADGAVLTTDTPAPATAAVSQPAPPTAPASNAASVAAAPAARYTPPAAFTPIAEPALEPQEQAPAVPQQAALAPSAPVTAGDDDSGRAVGFLVMLAGLAFGGLAAITPARAEGDTIGLGRFKRPAPATVLASVPAEPITGGLGRFARTRTGPPPALS